MGAFGDLHRSLNDQPPRYRPPSVQTSAGRQATERWLDDDGERPAGERGRVRRWWDQDDRDPDDERPRDLPPCGCPNHQPSCAYGWGPAKPSLLVRWWRWHRRRVKARKAEQQAERRAAARASSGRGGGRR